MLIICYRVYLDHTDNAGLRWTTTSPDGELSLAAAVRATGRGQRAAPPADGPKIPGRTCPGEKKRPNEGLILVILVRSHTLIQRPERLPAWAAVPLHLLLFLWVRLRCVDARRQVVIISGGRPLRSPSSPTASCIMLPVTGWARWCSSTRSGRSQRSSALFYPLMQAMLLGVNWSFITGDVFNLFVAYEVMLMASYGMMMVGASPAQVRQTLKYIAINGIGSTLFVAGCGVVYATVGTLNMADLAVRTAQITGQRAGMVTAASMLLLLVFALKAATFPLIYWLPDSYPVVPAGVNGYFAGILTKVGVYSLLRVFVLCSRQEGHQFALDVLLFSPVSPCSWGPRRHAAGTSVGSSPGTSSARSATW
jgi:NADH:ubiquinone oxidoreductase subunit 2 (subunit N)